MVKTGRRGFFGRLAQVAVAAVAAPAAVKALEEAAASAPRADALTETLYIMCGCEDWLTCEHPWPARWRDRDFRARIVEREPCTVLTPNGKTCGCRRFEVTGEHIGADYAELSRRCLACGVVFIDHRPFGREWNNPPLVPMCDCTERWNYPTGPRFIKLDRRMLGRDRRWFTAYRDCPACLGTGEPRAGWAICAWCKGSGEREYTVSPPVNTIAEGRVRGYVTGPCDVCRNEDAERFRLDRPHLFGGQWMREPDPADYQSYESYCRDRVEWESRRAWEMESRRVAAWEMRLTAAERQRDYFLKVLTDQRAMMLPAPILVYKSDANGPSVPLATLPAGATFFDDPGKG